MFYLASSLYRSVALTGNEHQHEVDPEFFDAFHRTRQSQPHLMRHLRTLVVDTNDSAKTLDIIEKADSLS